MKIEHLALMVEDPIAMAAWYEAHLGMKIIKESKISPLAHFLADSVGEMMLEIFRLEGVNVPDYRNTDSQIFHLAFSASNIVAMTRKIKLAGGTIVENVKTLPSGDQVAMLRDPWGLPIQLVNRKRTLL